MQALLIFAHGHTETCKRTHAQTHCEVVTDNTYQTQKA